MTNDNWRPGPGTPRAHHVEMAFCADPNCGLHFISFDCDHNPICETVMSAAQTLAMVKLCEDFLYEKATQK